MLVVVVSVSLQVKNRVSQGFGITISHLVFFEFSLVYKLYIHYDYFYYRTDPFVKKYIFFASNIRIEIIVDSV